MNNATLGAAEIFIKYSDDNLYRYKMIPMYSDLKIKFRYELDSHFLECNYKSFVQTEECLISYNSSYSYRFDNETRSYLNIEKVDPPIVYNKRYTKNLQIDKS